MAKDEHIKQEATEAMNLKISGIQIKSYTETAKLPTLQYLADRLCEDEEMEYVIKKESEISSITKIDTSNVNSIFTKMKKYPYEFEVDSTLKLASIDGIKLAENSENYEELKNRIELLENEIQEKNKIIENRLAKLENNSTQRKTKLAQDNFSTLEIELSKTQEIKNLGNIQLIDSIENYRYLEIKIDVRNTMENVVWGEKTIFIAIDNIKYSNSDNLPFKEWNKATVFCLNNEFADAIMSIACYFKNEKEIVIGSAKTTQDIQNLRIKEIYGIN